jgi:hypothetical protein
MTATGQWACRTRFELTDPIRLRRNHPCPRDPITIIVASLLRSTSIGTVGPTTVSEPTFSAASAPVLCSTIFNAS